MAPLGLSNSPAGLPESAGGPRRAPESPVNFYAKNEERADFHEKGAKEILLARPALSSMRRRFRLRRGVLLYWKTDGGVELDDGGLTIKRANP